MIGIEYILNTILVYGLLFSLFYFEINYRPFIKGDRFTEKSYIRHGVMMGMISVVIMVIIDSLGIRNTGDGRFVILILAVIMYNLYTGLVAAIFINAYVILTIPNALTETLVTTMLTIFVAEVYKHHFIKSKHQYMLIVALTTGLGVINMSIGVFISPRNPYVNAIEKNIIPALILFAIITCASYYLIMSNRTMKNRIKTLFRLTEDLETQNEEIKTLYENVSHTEFTLKKNYEILDDYRWRLETSEKRYERVLDASSEGFFDYYPITRVWVLSKRFCELLGYEHESSDRLSRELFQHIPLAYRSFESYFEEADLWPESRMISLELQFSNREGYLKWYAVNAIADIDETHKITRITGSLLDIHQRKIEQEKVEFYAFHDPVTGFLNEDYFSEMIKKLMFEGQTDIKVFYVSIARFDKLLKVYGKKIMDILQYQLGNEIQNYFGNFSSFSVMSSGSFGVLITDPSIEKEQIEIAIARLNQKFEKAVHIINVDVQCALMYPYYECERHEKVEVVLDRLAETKSYCEENNHYGRLKPFDWDFFNKRTFHKEISVYLKTAITENRFEVHYQPQVIYEDGRFAVDGFEALVRLRHPSYGVISPTVFIDIAENLGEIHKIDGLVLDKAIEFSKTNKKLKKPMVKIAINLSFIDLLNTEHIMNVIDKIKKCREQGVMIAIEITESAIAKYIDEVRGNLEAIKRASIEIHLDDFGTGYSSLSQLTELPISTLKIDKSFITQMMSNDKVSGLVEMMIKIGRQMNLEVIAEGIETDAQLRKLIRMDCKKFQGYYFSKPLTEEDALNFLGTEIDAFPQHNNSQW